MGVVQLGLVMIIHVITATLNLEDSLGSVLIVLLAIVWVPLKLFAVSSLYGGFELVGGFITYLVLTVVLTLLTGFIK